MTAGFPHPSRPGHFDTALSPEVRAWVRVVADGFIPGAAPYPSGSEAQIDHFVGDRASEEDVFLLATLAERWPVTEASEAAEALIRMETEDPESFVYLREFVFHGYYASRRALAAMADRGYRYHGAPQPLGYPRTEELLVPVERRGSFVPTGEVHRVAD